MTTKTTNGHACIDQFQFLEHYHQPLLIGHAKTCKDILANLIKNSVTHGLVMRKCKEV